MGHGEGKTSLVQLGGRVHSESIREAAEVYADAFEIICNCGVLQA